MSTKPPEERTFIRPYMTCDPREIEVDWKKNVARSGREPELDDDLRTLALSIRPKNQGGVGQLQPVIVRPLADNKLELIGGFRRLKASLWLIESGQCPDFRIQCITRRLNDAEAAVSNLTENLDRKDISTIELAHAVRSLNEDYGLSMPEIATRLNRTAAWLDKILGLTMLATPIQEAVSNGQATVTAALEIASLPPREQVATFDRAKDANGRVKAESVKAAKRERHEKTGEGGPVSRGIKDVKNLIGELSASNESTKCRKFVKLLSGFLSGELAEVKTIDSIRRLLAD